MSLQTPMAADSRSSALVPASAISSPSVLPIVPNPLAEYNELRQSHPEFPDFVLSGVTNHGPWEATLRTLDGTTFVSPIVSTQSEAKRIVAEKYLDAMISDWRTKAIHKLSSPAISVTERTPDQALHEIAQLGDCDVTHPYRDADNQFFVGRASYKSHNFEERVPISKDHSACKKECALKLIVKLAMANHALAERFLHQLRPAHFFRGRLMPNRLAEGVETEFKGNVDEHEPLSRQSRIFGDLQKEILRNVCAFLNTNGGSLWYGVHDSGIVQGMALTQQEHDQLELSIRNTIGCSLDPLSWDFVTLRWYEVEDDPALLTIKSPTLSAGSSSPSPVNTGVPDRSGTKLSPSSSTSKGPRYASRAPKTFPARGGAAGRPRTPEPPNPSDIAATPPSVQARLAYLECLYNCKAPVELWLLEVCVLPSKVAHFWSSAAYYRNGNQTTTMPIPMLKHKIRHETPPP